MVDYVDVYETGGTTVQVEVNGETTLTTTEGQTVQVETIAGIKGETGQSGFVVEANGTYPARPPGALAVTFVGADNPDTLGLMQVGDTWINTAGTNTAGPGYVKGNTKAPVISTNFYSDPAMASHIAYSNNGSIWDTAADDAAARRQGIGRATKFTLKVASAAIVSGYYIEKGSLTTIPVTPGQTYSAIAHVKSLSSNRVAHAIVSWRASDGSFLSSAGGDTVQVANDGSYTKVFASGVAPASAAYVFAGFYVTTADGSNAPVGETGWVSDIALATGNIRNYFDGHDDGSIWTGAVDASTSQKLLVGINDTLDGSLGPRTTGQIPLPQGSGWKFSTTLYLEGTGFPTMDAPVGTMYIDTAATNGAIRWIKTKAGSGTVNWQVEYGDTGARKGLDSQFLNGATTGADGTSGTVIRRVGNAVNLTFSVATPSTWVSGTDGFTIPTGFLPYQQPNYLPDGYSKAGVVYRSGANLKLYWTGSIVAYRFNWNWITNDAWPAVLPGTAA